MNWGISCGKLPQTEGDTGQPCLLEQWGPGGAQDEGMIDSGMGRESRLGLPSPRREARRHPQSIPSL